MSSKWKTILVSGLCTLFLTACSGDDADDLCDGALTTANAPDITGSPTFSAGPYTAATTVTVTVPVDEDTQTVVVDFADLATNTTLGNASSNDLGSSGTAQPVPVDVILTGAVAGVTYYPVIMLCPADLASCTTGVGYIDDSTDLVSAENYVRSPTVTYDSGTTTITVNSATIYNTCVPVSSITAS